MRENIKKNEYYTGIYIRLSREDDDSKLESESITNQKSLLLQYVKENNYRLVDIYIDDGFSGTNFDRPAFRRMIRDIELGKINMVITKDMSRLGRDYIGTGNLIEKYFPEHHIRYIAVTDNVDTFLDNPSNDIAPFKAIMNDMYAKDISKKIKSSLRAKQKEGKWVGGRTPFGYDPNPEDKNHLIINEEQALIVKRIFDMCLEGLSFFKIAKQLTSEKIKTPAQYYNFKWKSNYNLKYGQWHPKTVKDILTNRIYIGDMIQNKRRKVNYKVKRVIKNNPKDYIVVENTHVPIIDRKIFYEVQKRIPKNKGRNEKKEVHLLDGLLYCGDCGYRISVTSRRKKDNRCYTICNYYRTYMKERRCTTHSNNYDELEEAIVKQLKKLCKKYIDKNWIKRNINLESMDDRIRVQNTIQNLTENLNQMNGNLDDIYIDQLNRKISKEQYIRVKGKVETNIIAIKKQIDNLKQNLQCLKSSDKQEIDKYIDDFLSFENPSRELLVNLIDKIEIKSDKTIVIQVSFSSL